MSTASVYEESLPFPLAAVAVAIETAVAIAMLVLFVLEVLTGPLGSRPAPDWVYLVMFLSFLSLSVFVAGFRKLTIRLTEQHMTVGFGAIRRKIPWGNIEDCFEDESSLLRYGGWGIRLARVGGRWRLAFNVVGHSGVVLRLRAGRPGELMFSTGDPQRVLELIRQRI